MKKFITLLYGIVAGFCIGIGGTVFLSLDNKIVGALLFTVGLFTICVNGYNLYTGKICYLFDNPPSYLIDLALIWIGNLIGAVVMGLLVRATRISTICAKAETVSAVKLDDSLISIFILAVLCGVMIFIAVDSFKNNPHEFGKYVGLFLGISVFILCGFEHVVANMFYFTVAGAWDGHTILYIIVMTLGNSVGGWLFPLARKLKKKVEA